MEEIIAKTILQKTKPNMDFWFYSDYNMNLYRGCSHGCIYCDSRSLCYGIEDFDTIRSKKDAVQILESELQKKRQKGIIGMGAMSDPYNPLEKSKKLTRDSLKLILKYGFGTSIITKSHLIVRDIDLLKQINEHHSVIVNITITTADPNLQKIIEPYSSTTLERFEALKQLNDAGIHAGITFMPILPFINDTYENIDAIVSLAKQYHVKHIFPWFGMTCRDRQRDYFYMKLEEHFPEIKQKYIQTFGERYECPAPNAKNLYSYLERVCKKEGILNSIREINEAFYHPPKQMQLEI